MNNFKRKGISTLLIISVAALLTIVIGSKVKAAEPWNHLWNYPAFRIDTSFAGAMTSNVIGAANDYSNNTDLTVTSALGALQETVWRNDQGWVRTVGVDSNGGLQWGGAPTAWSGPVGINGLPGSSSMQTIVNYRIGNSLVQGYWRGNQGWTRNVPIVNDAVQWESAPAFSGPISIAGMPGSGDMQAHGDYAVGNTLIQAIWRNNQGWTRNVQIVNGVVQWGQAGQWGGPISINGLPGSGNMQAQDNFVIGNTYWQVIWRSNVQWTRSVPIVNGVVQFNQASQWVVTTHQESMPGVGNVQAQGNYFLDWTGTGTDLVPPHGEIQVEVSNMGWVWSYQGYALPLNGNGDQCYYYPTPSPTHNCDTQKAISARIFYNTYYLTSNPDYLARHEIGHVFGLYHPPCSAPDAVMLDTPCNRIRTVLQLDDIQWINLNY